MIYVLNQPRSGYKKFWSEVLEMEELCDKIRIRGKRDASLENVLKDGKAKLEAVRGDDGVKERFMNWVLDVETFIDVQEKLPKGEVNWA